MKRLRLIPVAALLLTGCAAPGPTATGPGRIDTRGGYPGFDTSIYPGEAALRAWRAASPYQWIGYYLVSPCHRETSWVGARAAIERSGFGIALLYVGQQAFENHPLPSDTIPPDRIICSQTLLTVQQGRADAADAVARASAEGFPAGSVIYLDVERMQSVPASMVIYYQAWLDAVLVDGRFKPGTYAHRANAAELYGLAQTAYLRSGRTESPAFWIAGGGGTAFTLDRAPADSGFLFARIWQGILDVRRSWGGVTLLIDENVSDRPSPSMPGS